MRLTADDAGREAELRAYLLGALPAARQDEIDEQVISDADLHAEVQATADDLIHAYLAGELTPEDRDRFEAHFLASPPQRERVAFVRGLVTAVESMDAAAPPSPVAPLGVTPAAGRASIAVWAAVAAGLVAVLGAGWLYLQNARPREGGGPIAERPSAAPSSPAAIDPSPDPAVTPAPGPTVVALRLPARSPGQPVDLPLGAETRTVRLEVPVSDGDSATFDAVLRRPNGEEVWREEGLAPKRFGAPIVVTAPTDVLADGEYVLTLQGEPTREGSGSSASRYRLRVLRTP